MTKGSQAKTVKPTMTLSFIIIVSNLRNQVIPVMPQSALIITKIFLFNSVKLINMVIFPLLSKMNLKIQLMTVGFNLCLKC